MVELKQRQIDSFHLDLPHGNEPLPRQLMNGLVALGDFGIECGAILARHAAEGDEDRLVLLPRFGDRFANVVVDPQVAALGVFIVNRISKRPSVGSLPPVR